MSDTISTKSEVASEIVGDFPNIEILAAEHDRISGEIARLPQTIAGYEAEEHLNNRLWALRALMGATSAKSPADIHALARILHNEASRDADFECHAPGSARDLTRALAEGVMALQAAA